MPAGDTLLFAHPLSRTQIRLPSDSQLLPCVPLARYYAHRELSDPMEPANSRTCFRADSPVQEIVAQSKLEVRNRSVSELSVSAYLSKLSRVKSDMDLCDPTTTVDGKY